MVQFYDTTALLNDPDKITSDIWISEVSVQELENIVYHNYYEEGLQTRARAVLNAILREQPIVVLLQDAIKWCQGQDLEIPYDIDKLMNRDFLSVILTAYYIKSICDEEFKFYTDSYLTYVNATSLYFNLPTEYTGRKLGK